MCNQGDMWGCRGGKNQISLRSKGLATCQVRNWTHSEQTKSYSTDSDGVVHSESVVRGYAEGSSNMNVVSGNGVLP